MEGDANGAAHPDPAAYAKKFTGRYQHRNLDGGIGHNLPQEAPKAFGDAIIDVTRFCPVAPQRRPRRCQTPPTPPSVALLSAQRGGFDPISLF
jgi:hypothetical protein